MWTTIPWKQYQTWKRSFVSIYQRISKKVYVGNPKPFVLIDKHYKFQICCTVSSHILRGSLLCYEKKLLLFLLWYDLTGQTYCFENFKRYSVKFKIWEFKFVNETCSYRINVSKMLSYTSPSFVHTYLIINIFHSGMSGLLRVQSEYICFQVREHEVFPLYITKPSSENSQI